MSRIMTAEAYRSYTKSQYRTKSKYRNKTQVYGGRKYDSIREANHAEELDWRIKEGEVKEVIPQYKISLDVNGVHIANYYMDFRDELSDGQIEYHEVKGMELPLWQMKWKLLIALKDQIEPGVKLLVIK
jgi:hypothetical protein